MSLPCADIILPVHNVICGVRGREVERRPCNHEVPSSSPGSGSELWDFSLGPHIRREYWCSSRKQNRERLV